jgi:prophage antirepressor-like protein
MTTLTTVAASQDDPRDPRKPRFFNFDALAVRVVGDWAKPWFVAADVCAALGLVEAHRAIAGLDEDEKGSQIVTTLGGPQAMSTVSESGLYALIFRSRKEQAKIFRKWVTAEVLPTIRREGGYVVKEWQQKLDFKEVLANNYHGQLRAEQEAHSATKALLLAAQATGCRIVWSAELDAELTAHVAATKAVRLFAEAKGIRYDRAARRTRALGLQPHAWVRSKIVAPPAATVAQPPPGPVPAAVPAPAAVSAPAKIGPTALARYWAQHGYVCSKQYAARCMKYHGCPSDSLEAALEWKKAQPGSKRN